MSVIWKVNGQTLEAAKLTLVGGTFRTQGISYALLDSARGFDEDELFGHGQAVALTRTEGSTTTTVFQGKVAPIGKRATPEYEGHDYPLEDAWADLERTTYQESWNIGVGSYFFPKAVLGLDSAGEQLTVGQQIAEIINYAASVGVAIQMGTVPDGEILWPSQVQDIFCAEAINLCLEFHPDWVAYLDHATTPPTFNVQAVSALDLESYPVTGTGRVESFKEVRRDDLLPEAVRVIYEWATTIDDEVYRDASIDLYPPGGPEGGPGVICVTIPLAGGTMQMQKSRIRVRPIPESGDLSDLTKKWVKANYPRLANVDLEDFEVTEWETSLHVDDLADNPHPPEINEQALRLVPEEVSDIPNQLLEGSIEDWMRRKVGWINFRVKVEPAEGASAEVQAEINKDFPPGRCVATNAISKLYKGVTQWALPEEIPTGIAQGIYQSMTAAWKWEGEVTISEGELTGTRHHGRKVTLSGAGTTNAPVHTVAWDVATGKTTIGFGPVPELAPADFLELQRRTRGRKVTWWSSEERADNKLGAEEKPSAAGDTVAGYHTPQIIFDATSTAPAESACSFGRIIDHEGERAIAGGLIMCGENNFNLDPQVLNLEVDGKWLVQIKLTGVKGATDDLEQIFLPGGVTGATGTPEWDNKTWSESADYDDTTNPESTTGTADVTVGCGILTIEDGVATFVATGCGTIEITQCAGIFGHTR